MASASPTRSIQEALAHADALWVAMQLSNFLRNIGQDLRIGRIYLHQEDLTRFGIAETDLTENRLSPQFIRLMDYEIERTEGFSDLAYQGVQKLASGRWGVMCGLKT